MNTTIPQAKSILPTYSIHEDVKVASLIKINTGMQYNMAAANEYTRYDFMG